MSLLYERLAELERRAALGEELRARMVKAESWDQLFQTPEEAKADFLKCIIRAHQRYLEENRTLQQYTVESHPDGDIHIFGRQGHHQSRYQRLRSGDVVLEFHSPGKGVNRDLITANVGNIDHPYTDANTIVPDTQVIMEIDRTLGTPEYDAVKTTIGTDPFNLLVYLAGKPATAAWERIMLGNGHLPQRIGHLIIPNFVLEAQVKFASAYPDLMPTTQS